MTYNVFSGTLNPPQSINQSKALRYDMCQRGITQLYLTPTRLSTSGMNHTCLYIPTTERHRTLASTHFPSRWG